MAKYVDNNGSLVQNVCKSKARMILQTGVNLTNTINSYRNVSRSNFYDGKILWSLTSGFTVSCFIIAKYETDRNCSWFAKFRSLRETNTIKNEKKICSSCYAKRKKYINTKKTCLELFGENKNRKQCFEMFTF